MTTQARLTERQKVEKCLNMKAKSFRFRLGAALACGGDRGSLTCWF